jgi:ankyrin repeat protein
MSYMLRLQAARLGHADVLFYYLERSLVPLDAEDSLGRTLLFVACLHDRMDVAQLMLTNTGSDLVDT